MVTDNAPAVGLTPTGPSTGKRRYRTASKIRFIKDKLQGYTGNEADVPGAAVVSELIQNADDAEASEVTFRFHPDYFEAGNDKWFMPEHFNAITEMLAGQKEDIPGKIGAFGTGFISVYHLTDTPHLHSSRQHIVFDPNEDNLDTFDSPVDKGTTFLFPWRKEQTETGYAIGAKVWCDEDIRALKEGLGLVIYRLILFLRHVRRISVYDGDGSLLSRVVRHPNARIEHANFVCEQWTITYQKGGEQVLIHEWLYYHTTLNQDHDVEGVTVKDRVISVAMPIEGHAWLTQHVPGTLYNFLPTAIRTPFAFHLNGAFFPDNNRRSILLDASTQPGKAQWNEQVVKGLGLLVAGIAVDIRDNVPSAKRFYELLPLQIPEAAPFLKPVYEEFRMAAPHLPLVWSSLRTWLRPDQVKVGGPPALRRLAAPYIAILPHDPHDATSAFRSFLGKEMKSDRLCVEDVLNFLEPRLQREMSLDDVPLVNSLDNMRILYDAIQNRWDELDKDGDAVGKQALRHRLQCLPLYPGDDDLLYVFTDDMWCADAEVRALALNGIARFVVKSLQDEFPRFLSDVLSTLGGAELVDYLSDHLRDSIGVPLQDACQLINDRRKLLDVLHVLHRNLDELNQGALALLPLVLDDDGILGRAVDLIRLPGDDHDRMLLKALGLRFVAADFLNQRQAIALYDRAGVQLAHPDDVVTQLNVLLAPYNDNAVWNDVPPPIDTSDGLAHLYDYFYRHHYQLGDDTRERLLSFPLFPTQDGTLRSINGSRLPLQLPPIRDGSDQHIPLAVLELDNVVAEDVLHASGRAFLSEVLAIETLSSFVAVRDHVLRRYEELPLSHEQRFDLLRFVRAVWNDASLEHRDALQPMLRAAPLLRRPGDDTYARGSDLYYKSDELDTVFPDGYSRLHMCYPADWITFLDVLGVCRRPAPHDLLSTITKLVTVAPSESNISTIKAIYGLLQRELGREYQLDDPALQQLAAIEWLPARNDPAHWYAPGALYPGTARKLIGNHHPLLLFDDPDHNVSTLLRIPTVPPIERVIDHLHACRSGRVAIDDAVYGFLAAHATADHLDPLKDEAVVWDHRRETYTRPDKVVAGDYEPRFGDRRYFVIADRHDVVAFLAKAKTSYVHPWEDALALIGEIADEYPDDRALSSSDRQLVIQNLDYLGEQDDDFSIMKRDYRGILRSARLALTQQGRLAAVDAPGAQLKLPAGQGDAAWLGELNTLELDTFIDAAVLRGPARRFLTDVVGVEEIDPCDAVRDYVLHHYNSPRLTHEQRMQLLKFVRSVWENASGDVQAELKAYLKTARLIRCQDDEYRSGANVYYPSDELDSIFAEGYIRPHTAYESTTLASFFTILGVHTHPVAEHVLSEVAHIVESGEPDGARASRVRRIYEYLNQEIGGDKRHSSGEKFVALRDMFWLPVRKNERYGSAWHRPMDVYTDEYVSLVGSEAPVLRFEERPADSLRAALSMPTRPPVAVVVQHLFTSMAARRRVTLSAYRDLGERWSDIDAASQTRLQSAAVFWHEERFWPGSHIYLGDHRYFFGKRRLNLTLTAATPGMPQAFLRNIGARLEPHPWKDHLALLQEIADDYADGRALAAEDRQLLLKNFDQLGRQPEAAEFEQAARSLGSQALVPGKDGRLHRPGRIVLVEESERRLLEHFDPSAVPVVNAAMHDSVGLTEYGRHFVRAMLGVVSIGSIFERSLVATPPDRRHNEELSRRLQGLAIAFRRIALTVREQHREGPLQEFPTEQLEDLQFYICAEVPVEYALDNAGNWRVEGQRGSTPALYDSIANVFYVQEKYDANGRRRAFRRLDIAREIENVFFPESKVSAVIEQLLHMTPDEADRYLTKHGYRQLYADHLAATTGNDAEQDETDWYDDEGTSPGAECDNAPIDVSQDVVAAHCILDEHDESVDAPDAASTPPIAQPTGGSQHDVRRFGSVRRNVLEGLDAVHSFPQSPRSPGGARRLPSTDKVDWQADFEPADVPLRDEPFKPAPSIRNDVEGVRAQSLEMESDDPADVLSQRAKVAIGQWGEAYTLGYLAQHYLARHIGGVLEWTVTAFTIRCNGNVAVTGVWLNGGGIDTGEGHDIRVEENSAIHYYEVKSTKSEAKTWIDLSGRQWRLAKEQRAHFHILRVYNAGTRQAKVTLIDDPVRQWESGAITAFTLRIKV